MTVAAEIPDSTGLADTAQEAVIAAESLVARATAALRDRVTVDGTVSAAALERE